MLAGFSAVVAHLLGGGAIGSSVGLLLGSLSAGVVAMIALYRPGALRVGLAMAIGQYAFHVFLGVGAPATGHHQEVVAPLVTSGNGVPMGVTHLVAAGAVAVLVSGADRALRVLGQLAMAIARFVRSLPPARVPDLSEGRCVPPSAHTHLFRVLKTDYVGSCGLRGPPAVA